MKTILTLSICLLLSALATAQESHFDAGIGVSGWGIPVYVRYDTPVDDDIYVGGMLSYRSRTTGSTILGISNKWRHTIIGISARGMYNFDRLLELESNLDTYGGVSLGYYVWNTKYVGDSAIEEEYIGDGNGGLGLRLFIGGRYYFNESWGVNLELGGGNVVSGAAIGVTKRL